MPQQLSSTTRSPALAPVRARATAASVALHLVLLGLAFLLGRQSTTPPPIQIRLVYVEPKVIDAPAPAPPPPAAEPAQAAPIEVPQTMPHRAAEKPIDPPQRKHVIAAKKPPAAQQASPPAPDAAASDAAVGGLEGGVVGGEVGGKEGGRIGGQGDAPVREDQVAHPPTVVSRVVPTYPAMARARGIEGRVLLRAIVDRDGHVEPAVEVIESMAPFDVPAVDALRQWHFHPGSDADGKTVRVVVEVPMRFQLR